METRNVLDWLATLLEYPTASYHGHAEACLSAARAGNGSEAAEGISVFCDAIRPLAIEEIEELYTRTFDLNPTCSLDIGWHLYGEQYARGDFLVTMRTALRDHAVEESTELPDHLPSVLRLLARLEPDEAADLSRRAVYPAVGKMLAAFGEGQNPYRSLLEAVSLLVPSPDPEPEEVSP